jgi:hypothetical protein
MNRPRRAISKEGPAPLYLAFYQAGSVARTVHPQLAASYHRLKTGTTPGPSQGHRKQRPLHLNRWYLRDASHFATGLSVTRGG